MRRQLRRWRDNDLSPERRLRRDHLAGVLGVLEQFPGGCELRDLEPDGDGVAGRRQAPAQHLRRHPRLELRDRTRLTTPDGGAIDLRMSYVTAEDLDLCLQVRAMCACNQLRRASRGVTQHYETGMAPSGIKATQLPILVALGSEGDLSITRLAGALSLDRTSLTRNLGVLEGRRLIPSSSTRTTRGCGWCR